MRMSILAFPSPHDLKPVLNALATGHLDLMLMDRKANGEAFPGERVIRLPRRLGRAIAARTWFAGYSTDSVDIRRTLKTGRVLFYGEEIEHERACPCSDCKAHLRNPFI